MTSAMEQWWHGRGNASLHISLFDDCDDVNCNPTCSSHIVPGTRDEADGMLVWIAVTMTLVGAIVVLGGGKFNTEMQLLAAVGLLFVVTLSFNIVVLLTVIS